MEIVYTYKTPIMKIYSKEVNQKDWIIRSIDSARKVGYSPHLYTNDEKFAEGLDLDNLTILQDEYPEVWDTLKTVVLSLRNDTDFFISDNDVIYKNKIPFDDTVDFYFDGIETGNWEWAYQPSIQYFKKYEVFDTNPIWDYNKRQVLNCGMFKINNNELKHKFIEQWKDIYERLLPHYKELSSVAVCGIINQFPLTLLNEQQVYRSRYFTNNGWPGDNDYYNHYPGYTKVKKSTLI